MDTTIIQGVTLGFLLGFVGFIIFTRNPSKNLKSNNYKIVMVVRTDILKNKTQTAIHCSRAALECFKKAKLKYPDAVNIWEKNSQPKIALKLDKNENEEMLCLHRKAERLGLVSVQILEENSYQKNDIAVLGIGPGSEELVNEVTGHLKLL
ncbi:unnamed protein product [Nezara viridula]|uniref:peptidyl-tRNA hydrolase n=1 Tax=Nezara viridula TaxID=85310 RepID=A0A9P0H1M8_NEZVI|nr:unnamed protein product [Nezara viridula]